MVGSPFTEFTFCDLSDVHIQFRNCLKKRQSVVVAAGDNLLGRVIPYKEMCVVSLTVTVTTFHIPSTGQTALLKT